MQTKFAIAVVVLAALAAVRVASTHRVFSEVLDEPAHLASGFEWFHGRYDVDASHPPLARVLSALPFYAADFPRPRRSDFATMGNELLYHGNYVKNVARARMGNLVLLMIAIVATAYWAKRVFSPIVGILTAAILATLPPILGHAGVATTDLAALAGIAVALLALDAFLEDASAKRGALLGLALGIGLLGKFSFLVYFPPCAALALFARWPARGGRAPLSRQWRSGVVAMAIAFVTLWAGYRFDFRSVRQYAGDHGVYALTLIAPDALAHRIADVRVPAPAFFVGLGFLKMHDQQGHLSYLLGEMSEKGWWYYFPVVFFYKTPLPFLILVLWGAALLRTRAHVAVALMPLAILGIAMTSSINIGVRHILPMYAPLAILAAYASVEIWTRTRDVFGRVAFAALMAWLFAGVALSHPDYLAWFNELAQPNPSRVAVDSNLDWGQDTLRLARVVRELGIEELHADVMTNARLAEHGIRHVAKDPAHKISGWVAVSETTLALKARWGQYEWLRSYRPVRRVGESIRLYSIP